MYPDVLTCGHYWRRHGIIRAWFEPKGAANDQVLKEILEVDRPPILTDYYTSCMASQDTGADHRRHATPSLTPYIAAINRTRTPEDLVATIGLLHQVGVKAMWYLSVGDDLEAPKTNMLQVVQGGLGLPGAEYYSGASADMKAAYIAHVAKVLELVSEGGEDDPGANAGGVAEEGGSGSSKKTARRKHANGAPTTTTRTPYAEAAEAVFVFESQLAGITVPNASTGDFLKAVLESQQLPAKFRRRTPRAVSGVAVGALLASRRV